MVIDRRHPFLFFASSMVDTENVIIIFLEYLQALGTNTKHVVRTMVFMLYF